MSFIEELKKEEKSLKERLNAVQILLQSYEPSSKNIEPKADLNKVTVDYNLAKDLKKSSTPQKLLLVLKENQRFMKIREIANFLTNQIGGDEDDWVTKLSRTTGKLKKLNKIKSYKLGKSNSNTFWGSPSWLNEKNEIKNGYEFNDEVVEGNGSDLFVDL